VPVLEQEDRRGTTIPGGARLGILLKCNKFSTEWQEEEIRWSQASVDRITNNNVEFVRQLRKGDRIAVWARAQVCFPTVYLRSADSRTVPWLCELCEIYQDSAISISMSFAILGTASLANQKTSLVRTQSYHLLLSFT
jgi:hypothetical protein